MRSKVSDGEPLERRDIDGYQSARDQMWLAQHYKCAYCEDNLKQHSEPVEHFRPALKALRGPSYPDHGYWWLAWTWTNLLFACTVCNGKKGARFELVPPGAALAPEQLPPGHENPLLVNPADPTDPDPMELIQFVPRRLPFSWAPIGRTGSRRGQAIVEALGLDLPAQLDRYAHFIRYRLDRYRLAVASAAGTSALPGQWEHVRDATGPQQPWAGLAFDYFSYHFPPSWQSAEGLPSLVRP